MLAINGGKPVRSTFLPYTKHSISEDDIQVVTSVLRNDFISQGPQIKEFENEICRLVGCSFGVAFANGTAALHAACYAAGIQAGDEVITTPLTFVATSNSVLYVGGTPVFADICADTLHINQDEILSKVTTRTKAIIPVDFAGNPVNISLLCKQARSKGIVVIHDAAHSLGSLLHGKLIGSDADMTMFSFQPTKHITTGEGGIIVTNNKTFYSRLLSFRNHGIVRDSASLMNKGEELWYYEMQHLGYNYRLTDFQAALGKSQLARLQAMRNRRAAIHKQYNAVFSCLPGLCVPQARTNSQPNWHLYVLRWEIGRFSVLRNTIFAALRAENIGVNVHYIPVYRHPFYRALGLDLSDFPVTERIYQEIITLPLFPDMSDSDVSSVIEAVKKVHKAFFIGKDFVV